jgi:transposase
VFEATGAYHRHLEAALAANGTAFAKVNPRQARRFAEATGRLAKTDRVDAIMLAKMGAVLGLKADQPKSEVLHILRELMTARRALMKDKWRQRPGCRQPGKPCSEIRLTRASSR